MTSPPKARRLRPDMPRYGILPERTDGMLSWDWVAGRMKTARNYWVCSTRPDGGPHAAPVWGAWVEGSLYFGTDEQSVKARNIDRDSRVVVHLESGDDTVIFEGNLLETQPPAELQAAIDAAYIEKYGLDPELEEDDGARLYRLLPRKVMAWREKDYPSSATCWLFDV